MAGYTRQSTADIVSNAVIKAAPVNAEYNALRDAFALATGHKHDGSSTEGAHIPLIADTDALNKVVIDTVNDRISFYSQVSTGTVEQVRIQDGAIIPVTDNDIDLGSATAEFKDLYIDGIGYIDTVAVHSNATIAGTLDVTGLSTLATVDINGGNIDATTVGAATPAAATVTSLTATTVDINGGNIDGTAIGAASPSTIVGTTVTATNFVGPIAGAVTGNVTGNTAGVHTGAVTGDVTGNVTAGSGTSSFNNVTINGSLDMNASSSATVTGLSAPVLGSDAANKTYVDQEVSAVLDAAPAALDTLNELAAALGDDANFSTTVTNSIATKLPLAGGTLSGALAMGSNKVTGLGAPTTGTDATTKTYVDAGDALQVTKAGDTMSGVLAMGANKITGVADPTQNQDAATKVYVDVILGSATAAATSASNAATSESNSATSAAASSNSATASAGSATSAANSLASFTGQYVSQTTAPSSPDTGDLWFDEATAIMKVYDGVTFVNAGSTVNGIENSVSYTATASQTTFNATYDVGYLHVFQNGLRLDSADYTASNGTSVVLGLGATVGDTVYIQAFGTFELADHYNKVSSDARFTNTAYVDAAIAGIVDSSPAALNTLNELAAALGDDANYATTTATTIGTKLPKAGGTMTGDIAYGDNVKAKFGAGDDLSIYHDGSNSYIKETGTGYLTISSGTDLVMESAGGEKFIHSVGNEGVTSYYNGIAKLATTSTGVDISGTVTADGLVVDGNAELNGNALSLDLMESDQVDKNLRLRANGGVFSIQTLLDNKSSTTTRMQVSHTTGDISFYNTAGTTPKFFWDSSAESLNLSGAGGLVVDRGTSSGAYFYGSSNDRRQLVISSGTGDNSNADALHDFDASGADGVLSFSTGGSERLRVDSSGNVGIGAATPLAPVVAKTTVTASSDKIVYGMTQSDNNAGRIVGMGIAATGSVANQGINFYTCLSSVQSERMRIDSSGNVGMGTSSPASALHVRNITAKLILDDSNNGIGGTSYTPNIELLANGTKVGSFGMSDNKDLRIKAENINSASIDLWTGGSERVTLDSSGNLLVGKTASSYNNAGAEIRSSGEISSSGNGINLVLNRQTTDGILAQFRQDNSTVGSINSKNTDLAIGTTDVGLRFYDSGNAIYPHNVTTNVSNDDVITLGNGGARFKDLFLSGGVYLGGTGSANKLDDYESGTWTPVISDATSGGNIGSGSSVSGRYVKVGDQVTVALKLTNIVTTGLTASNNFVVQGLPFTAQSISGTQRNAGAVATSHITSTGTTVMLVNDNASHMLIGENNSGAVITFVDVSQVTSGTADLSTVVTYFTNA